MSATSPLHTKEFSHCSFRLECSLRPGAVHTPRRYGFEYKLVWTLPEENKLKEVAHVWALRERFPEGFRGSLDQRDVLADGGKLPPRGAPIPGRVKEPRKVTEASLLTLPWARREHI